MGSWATCHRGSNRAVLVVAVAVLVAGAARPITKPGKELALGFQGAPVGRLPAGFSPDLTGEGAPGAWLTLRDAGTPGGVVLAQTSADDTDYRFPVCVYDGLTARDVAVSVRFKTISGRVDQAAGLVARYRDPDNYYVTRANALEGNVRLYKVVHGQRQQFAGVAVPVSSGRWHSLTLAVMGEHFEVTYDGRHLFAAEDRTFAGAGKVGLWTKADSVTHFADLRVRSFGR